MGGACLWCCHHCSLHFYVQLLYTTTIVRLVVLTSEITTKVMFTKTNLDPLPHQVRRSRLLELSGSKS